MERRGQHQIPSPQLSAALSLASGPPGKMGPCLWLSEAWCMSISVLCAHLSRALCIFGLLTGLCLAGCRPERPNRVTGDAEVAPATTPTPSMPPEPTFTPRPPPTPAVPSSGPTVTGEYLNPATHLGGHYQLQRVEKRVTATFNTTRSPLEIGKSGPSSVLFTVPQGFRPPFDIWRDAAGQVIGADGIPDLHYPAPYPFRLWLTAEGLVYYEVPAEPDLALNLAYDLVLAWGTTPAANDQVVLEKLTAARSNSGTDFKVTFDHQGRVIELRLYQGQLQALPSELGQLTHLHTLDLRNTRLATLPPTLGQLANLQELYLSGVQLTALPPALGQLVNLQKLFLDDNQFTDLPSELGQLTHLHTLDLSGNPLADLPSVLVQLPNLQSLTLKGIAWTDFPPLLSKLTQLRVLRMHGNGLTGRIPPELGQLTHLEVLNFWGGCGGGGGDPTVVGNALTGPIPPELGQLSQLRWLDLSCNQLTGSIPPELGQLSSLQDLTLFRNALTGPIPPELGQLSQLEVLSLARNALTGPIPPGLGQLHRLRDLYLSHNQLSGPVPPELGAIPDLNQVFLNGNDLTGCLPAHWEGYHVSVMSGDIAERSTWLPFCED